MDLLGLTADEVCARANARLESGAGVALKVYRRVLLDGRFEPEAFGIKPASVEAWRREFSLELPRVVRVIDEPSNLDAHTIKAVLATKDGFEIEIVRIPMGGGERFTLCVSSQVGCKLACKFCETGKMGLFRNLEAHEIVGQLIVARTVLGWEISNIVFMGMGEPLDNTENVIQALRVLNDHKGLHYGQQRLRVCTAGEPEGIRELGKLGWKRMDLSISLNAVTDEQRSWLMPINKRHPLAELQAALVEYPKRRNFVFGINFCLLPGINNTREDARKIAEFCAPLGRVLVNVIPYNPGTDPLARMPAEEEIEDFIRWLEEEKLAVRRRITKGRSVMAACGQLGNVTMSKELRMKAREARRSSEA
jgi:23S rRNA (adenine2503-C2)-methyltransferase